MALRPARRTVLAYLSQRRGLIFVICIFISFMQAGLFAGRRDIVNSLHDNPWPTPDTASSSMAPTLEHPIPKLMAEAETSFRRLLSKQSRTLRAAVSEYKRRYKREPPKGFDLWWRFAKDNNVKMVDEYDGLMEDLAPFWELSGEELRRRAMQAGLLPGIDLVRVRNRTAVAVNAHPLADQSDVSSRAKGLRGMMEKYQHTLPDMDLPVNARAEGRVLVPWEHRQYPNITNQNSSHGIEYMIEQPLLSDWRGTGNVWESYRRTCSPSAPARRIFSSLRNTLANHIADYLSGHPSTDTKPGPDFTFATTTEGKSNFCTKPWTYFTQGHFFSDFRTIPVLYPVFSPAKAPGYLDIRVPSHYYYGSTPRYTYGWDAVNLELKAVDGMEVPWEDKADKIFWRGASSGGGSNPPGFAAQYQRHRFLRMASDSSSDHRTITFADPPSSFHYASTTVPIKLLNREIMDVAFVKPMGHEHYPGGLEAMMNEHRFGSAVPLGDHWAYKYLLDLDGMSYSGHFMGFMASDSAVLKATVYREYYSDWIQPWLHFIPLSSSYKEIYNIHAFFSGPTPSTLEAANSSSLSLPPEGRQSADGDVRLRRIARAGKQWKRTIGRTVDMEAYVYRLCLEYARLWADDRDSMNFVH